MHNNPTKSPLPTKKNHTEQKKLDAKEYTLYFALQILKKMGLVYDARKWVVIAWGKGQMVGRDWL